VAKVIYCKQKATIKLAEAEVTRSNGNQLQILHDFIYINEAKSILIFGLLIFSRDKVVNTHTASRQSVQWTVDILSLASELKQTQIKPNEMVKHTHDQHKKLLNTNKLQTADYAGSKYSQIKR